MKKILLYAGFIFLAFSFSTTSSSCARKTGCKITEEAHVKLNRKGELPTKRGKSNLFSKKQRKRN